MEKKNAPPANRHPDCFVPDGAAEGGVGIGNCSSWMQLLNSLAIVKERKGKA